MAKRHREMVRRHLSKELKKEWLAKWVVRSARRNREGKGVLLDELCEDYKCERKYTIKLLGGGLPPASGRGHAGTGAFVRGGRAGGGRRR
jgi:hypothetical protein